jgi:putative two-component system response regulator
MRILALDDDPDMLDAFETLLTGNGHSVERATSAEQALEIVRNGTIQVVLCDQLMPGMSGLDFCRAIRSERLPCYVYCIMVSALGGQEDRIAALTAGADDFLAKPFDARELLERIHVASRLLTMSFHDVTVFALAKLAESRDPDTGAHLERVQHYCRSLALELATLEKYQDVIDDEFVALLFQTSPLHDIGKVGVPDRILLKPGKLTSEEFEVMKTHTTIGAQTLQAALNRFPSAMFLQMARDIAASHHERFDGTGYPQGLAGEQIPLAARIVAVADVYDALTSKRIYKKAEDHSRARSGILQGRGTQFDPDVVDAFERLQLEFLRISRECRELAAVAA